MARWIHVTKPFDFHWSPRAVTIFGDAELGDQFVKDELADFAAERGYATEGKLDDASRSSKGKRKRQAAKAPDSGPDDRVAGQDMADDDRPDGGESVAPDAD